MPSDYERIRHENIRQYGESTRHLDFFGRLYADRTHFVFELLQNAEDAGATQLKFVLHKDRLDVWHNGRIFNEHDVRGICGVGEGTKAEDMGKIGKFGIGFKSVYAYTRRPSIFSGGERFAIEHYVRPVPLNSIALPKPWTTLISLPFSPEALHPNQAYHQILHRFRSLKASTILFLRHLTQVEWQVEGGEQGMLSYDFTKLGAGRRKMALTVRDGKEEEETWLVFERPVSLPKGSRRLPNGEYEVFGRTLALPSNHKEALKVEIAFFLDQDKRKGEQIGTARVSHLVVFFPTDKETELGFLMQGLYTTTPARDNIRINDPWNEYLISETAKLLVDALEELKRLGLLSVQAINTLPLRPSKFGHDNPFRPIFDAVRTALRDRPLLPTHDGSFTAARDAKLARGAGLIELLPPTLLGKLFGSSKPIQWLTSEISLDRTPDLYRYLVGRFERAEDPERLGALVERIEIRPETVLAQLTPAWLKTQPDAWMIQFYSLFNGIGEADIRKLLRTKEIIRLSNGEHVAAYGAGSTPRVHLPSSVMADRSFPTVKATIAAHPDALEFLKSLGLSVPNVATEVLECILPKYHNNNISVDAATYLADVRKILQALEQSSEREAVAAQVCQAHWIRARNLTTEVVAFKLPREVYLRSLQLEIYFEGYNHAWVVDLPSEIVAAVHNEVWHLLGVANKPRRLEVPGILSAQAKVDLRGGEPCTHDVAIKDYDLDGLEHFLKSCGKAKHATSQKRALALWDFLRHHLREFNNSNQFWCGEYHWFYRSQWYQTFEACFLTRLKGTAWMPTTTGPELKRPADLSINELPDGFWPDESLFRALDILPDPLIELAKQSGFDPDDLRFVQNNPEAFAAWKKSMQRTKEEPEPDAAEPFDFIEALAQAFSKASHSMSNQPDQYGTIGGVRNPEDYRGQVEAEIKQAQQREPRQRFKYVNRKVWEKKDSQVRRFLHEQYHGECQICQTSFRRRDNQPHFEGLYLVSYTKADWIDQEGNILCLCPTCAAKFLHGSVEAEDILDQIRRFRALKEGGAGDCELKIHLCGDLVKIRYKERHMLRLQELIKAAK